MTFDAAMYDRIREGSKRSAAILVPYLYSAIRPSRLVDVGGGEGWWAHAFAGLGCDALVLDSTVTEWRSEFVGAGRLTFWGADLDRELGDLGVRLARTGGVIDLALCLEVAEHLNVGQADHLVAALCEIAPTVLWSAAIPGQGGHGHVNEQWPPFWHERFDMHGYRAFDFRSAFWNDERIEPWYRQNLLVYTSRDVVLDGLSNMFGPYVVAGSPLSLVHPEIYGWRLDELRARR